MLYILSLCTILPEPLRSTAPHQLCHVRHVRFGLLMTSLMLPHCLLIPRACCDPIATCCAACDAAAADALPCDAQTCCELRIQLRTCGTLCANCASTPLHSLHFPYALPQHHLPLQDPSLDPMRVLQRLANFHFSSSPIIRGKGEGYVALRRLHRPCRPIYFPQLGSPL